MVIFSYNILLSNYAGEGSPSEKSFSVKFYREVYSFLLDGFIREWLAAIIIGWIKIASQ